MLCDKLFDVAPPGTTPPSLRSVSIKESLVSYAYIRDFTYRTTSCTITYIMYVHRHWMLTPLGKFQGNRWYMPIGLTVLNCNTMTEACYALLGYMPCIPGASKTVTNRLRQKVIMACLLHCESFILHPDYFTFPTHYAYPRLFPIH